METYTMGYKYRIYPDAIFYGVRLDDGREIEVCAKSDDVDFL